MDYEKAYKEALELMKGCIPDGNGFVNIRPCDIFPELRESEDERIRKALIDFVQQYGDDFYSQVSKGRAIAWLEKQKIDPRQKYLNALLVADNIYQMAMNDEMVAEAESKAIDALMKLCITKYLLGKHGEQKRANLEAVDVGIGTENDLVPTQRVQIKGCKVFVSL